MTATPQRLRLNDVSSFGTANPITLASSVATVATWSTAPAFATITAPNYYVISVEPDTANEEIVYLISYTSGSVAGIVTRFAESTAGGASVAITHTATAWTHGPTAIDFALGPDISPNNTLLVGVSAFQLGVR